MSLDVWFQQDIRNTLLALHNAQSAHALHTEVAEAHIQRERDTFRDGFNAALQSVALAFGIPSITSIPSIAGRTVAGRTVALDVRRMSSTQRESSRRLAQPDERSTAARIVGQHVPTPCDAHLFA